MMSIDARVSTLVLAAQAAFGIQPGRRVIAVPAAGAGAPRMWPLADSVRPIAAADFSAPVLVIVVGPRGRTADALPCLRAVLDALVAESVEVIGVIAVSALAAGAIWTDLASPMPGGVVTAAGGEANGSHSRTPRRTLGGAVRAAAVGDAAVAGAGRGEPDCGSGTSELPTRRRSATHAPRIPVAIR